MKTIPPLIASAATGLLACLSALSASAQLAASGTPGDRVVYTIGAVGTIPDVPALPSSLLTHDFDTEAVADNADSFELGADGGADDTKIFLTGGHHIVIYGQHWDGGGERSGADSYLKLGGTKIPYGHSAAYTRDTTNRDSFTRGGTIINVAQGEFLELESQRRDIFLVDEPRDLTMQQADVQLIKLDDSNLEFLRLRRAATTQLMVTGGSGPANVPYDVQDEIDLGSFAHNAAVDNDQITLVTPGHYLVFANTGVIAVGGVQRQCITQKIFLDDDGAGPNPPALVTGGATTVYLRHAAANDAIGGLHDDGAAAVAVLVEVTAPNSVLTVEITRDSVASAASLELDETRTGLAIAKLPSYGDYISLGESGGTNNPDINTSPATALSFASNPASSNGSFDFSPGSPTQITVNKGNDYLFLSSHFVEDYDTPGGGIRTVVRQAFQASSGGAVGWGAGGSYNRDQPAGDQAARDSGDWAGAIIRGGTDVSVGGAIETTTERLGNVPVIAPTSLSFQGINIASISIPPSNDPTITVNAPLNATTGTSGNLITDEAHLLTEDANTPAGGLTYTLDTNPAGGTLRLNGTALAMNDSFTQDDINNDRITFDADPTPATGGFDFTVSDGGANPASGTFVIEVASPESTVTISDDGDSPEGGVTDFILIADVAPVGANMTVTLEYSGSAVNGVDFTGVTSVDILDGTTDATININVLTDGLFEGAETVTATIVDVSGPTVTGVIGNPASSTFFITDAGNNAPTTSPNLNQGLGGTGNVAIDDITVTDADADYDSTVMTAGTPLFQTYGIIDLTTYSDGRATDDSSHDLDATGPALSELAGFSIEINFIPQAGDLTGIVQVWEIGGSSNGSSIHLVDGVPHLLSKANGGAGDVPTDDLAVPGAFNDLDWAADNTVVVPLNGANSLAPGAPAHIALIFDIANNTVKSSVNGSTEAIATLINNDGNNWRGDHSVNTTNAGSGTGGSNNTTGAFGVAAPAEIKNLVTGNAAVSSVRFWNEATGSIVPVAGSGDEVTATLTISGWAAASDGTLSTTSGNGETFTGGVWSVTGTVGEVNAALAAVEFISGGTTPDPTFIAVSIDDGNEDGSTASTGVIIISAMPVDPIYVDDDFSGSFGDPIADADGGPPVSPALFGVSAFSNLTDALGAVLPTGTIIVNDGDYSSENITMTGEVTLQLTETAGPVQVGDIATGMTNSIDLRANTLELGATNVSGAGIDCPIIGAGGSLTKVGAGRLVLRQGTSYTGTTNITDGFLRVGFRSADGIQSDLSGDGPVVVTAPGRLELNVDVDKTISQTGAISGTGSVSTLGDGTVVFDGPGPNTFSGGFELGDGTTSSFDGVDQGAKQGFAVVNHSGHLGAGKVLSRGSQLQAGSPGLVIPNDIDITAGGFRCGGTIDFELSGDVNPIDNALRGYGNYGLEGLDILVSGNIDLTLGDLQVEGSNGKDNGSWTFTGDISGPGAVNANNAFDDGVVVFSGTHTNTGNSTFSSGLIIYDAVHTGGGPCTVAAGTTLAGSGSTTSAVTIQSGATLSPGSGGAGTFATGDLVIAGTLLVDLDGNTPGSGHDQIVVSGTTVDVSGATLLVNAGGGLSPAALTIIDNGGANPLAGTFVGLPEGGALDVDALGLNGTVSYLGGDGNDFAINFAGFTTIGGWRASYYGSSANAGPGANSELAANGLTNLQSFAFDLDPTVPAGALDVDAGAGTILSLGPPAIWIDPDSSRIYLRHTRLTDYASIPLTITDEFSRNPGLPFEASAVAPTVIATGTGDSGAAIEAVQTEFPLVLPASGGKGRYGRVNVATP